MRRTGEVAIPPSKALIRPSELLPNAYEKRLAKYAARLALVEENARRKEYQQLLMVEAKHAMANGAVRKVALNASARMGVLFFERTPHAAINPGNSTSGSPGLEQAILPADEQWGVIMIGRTPDSALEALVFDAGEWRAFHTGVKNGEFDFKRLPPNGSQALAESASESSDQQQAALRSWLAAAEQSGVDPDAPLMQYLSSTLSASREVPHQLP
ncbi:MAG TPA: hypothetical protein VMY99_03505 [Nevskiaceae bacterium]|nr:hypothetical protein [Nevskiaceae bacterium]